MALKKFLEDDSIKHAIMSILVGAVVAFLTTLLQGALNLLQNFEMTTGPLAAVATYSAALVRHYKIS